MARSDTLPATLKILRDEHLALTALLRTLLLLIVQARTAHAAPDFGALRALLFYVEEFPEKRHHRKESELLFPKLRARTPLQRGLLDRLDEEHVRGEHRVRELQRDLNAYEFLGDAQRAHFEDAAQRYVDFYLTHMALEEREILPLAAQVLTAEDWQELDEAMAADADPLVAGGVEAPWDALYQRVVERIPAPLGLGEQRHACN
jgi:hemerythrin-like domain-containing protein